ncbi:hypothetical protein MHB77_32405 [Paenibacillus sp. FSL K6-3166]|uniref:hypothetical protein n=1 Tax=Paenibacillus sp. FSL K6-3166 TaxID=2921492 RepID=UPI00117D7A9C
MLNTYGGGIVRSVAWWGWALIVLALIGVAALRAALDDASGAPVLCGIVLIAPLIIVGFTSGIRHDTEKVTPVRHEVTLRPGGVIDARKYDIIEQRGAIYVIEEREVAQ